MIPNLFLKFLINIKKKIKVIFHFAEFSRIAQSFRNQSRCFESNILGSYEVINFCLNNNIKIIYSATSACLGDRGRDQNLSPYAFSKSNNMNLIMNMHEWFDLKYEIIYFYNVYGPYQIYNTDMAAVMGVFEDCYNKNLNLPVVKPGTQTRKFTHVKDTVDACIYAWKQNKNSHYSISSKNLFQLSILQNYFQITLNLFLKRRGERFKSSVVNQIRGKKNYKFSWLQVINTLYKKLKKIMKYLVCGAGGFIGGHLVKNLMEEGHEVVCADIKPLEYWFQLFENNSNFSLDLKSYDNCLKVTENVDFIYNMACNMGGMGL